MGKLGHTASNLVWHNASVTRTRREAQNGHRGAIIWFTGLSGAGKSTLAHTVEEALHRRGCRTFVLDGDNIRHGLCTDLGFSPADRQENIRRVGEVAKLFMEAGTIVLTAFISPFRADRDKVRAMVAAGDFVEIFCDSSVEVCASRDTKGLYAKALAGHLSDFTGVSSPYEPPLNPELILDSGHASVEECADTVIRKLEQLGLVSLR